MTLKLSVIFNISICALCSDKRLHPFPGLMDDCVGDQLNWDGFCVAQVSKVEASSWDASGVAVIFDNLVSLHARDHQWKCCDIDRVRNNTGFVSDGTRK